jgi:hypothetical protein
LVQKPRLVFLRLPNWPFGRILYARTWRLSKLDFWSILLVVGGFGGMMGWFFTIPLTNGILAFCSWKDGMDIDWASEIGFAIAGPLAWFFAIFEIVLLYSR